MENLAGNLEEIFRGFFLTHRTKAQKFPGEFRGEFRSILCKKIRGSKKIFRAKFTLQTCHLNDEGSTVILQTAEVLGKIRGPSQEKSAALGRPRGDISKGET